MCARNVVLMFLAGMASANAASAGDRAGRIEVERRHFISFAARELGCHHPKRTVGPTKSWFILTCDYRKGGLRWLEFGTSPDQRNVNVMSVMVLLRTEDPRVPSWQPRLASRSVLRVARYFVHDGGRSARWTDRALRRAMTGHCSQSIRAGGYTFRVVNDSPFDLAIDNAKLTISSVPIPDDFSRGNCF